MGGTVRALTRMEQRQYAAIARWARRRPDVPAGATPLGYAQLAGPLIWLFVAVSAVELVVVHVLLHPWPVPRWIAFVLGLWGLVWMIGFLASYRALPHWVSADELRVRGGAAAEISVPLAEVAQVVVRERDLESATRLSSVVEDGDGRWCGLGVSGRTNLQLVLRRPLVVPHPGLFETGGIEVDAVGCWVDDPREARRVLDAARAGSTDAR